MSQELIAIIGFGIVLLGQGAWHIRSINGRIDRSDKRMDDSFSQVSDDFSDQAKQIGGLRERMAHLEGLLEGLKEAVVGRKAA